MQKALLLLGLLALLVVCHGTSSKLTMLKHKSKAKAHHHHAKQDGKPSLKLMSVAEHSSLIQNGDAAHARTQLRSRESVHIEYVVEAHATLRENLDVGTTVGFLSVVDADSEHNYDDHEYSIVEGGDYWEIGGDDNDELIAKFSADYETQDSYVVKVKAVDTTHIDGSDNTLVESFTIKIIDENDVKPYNLEWDSSLDVDENSVGDDGDSFLVSKLTFDDPDSENDFSFSLGGADNTHFEISTDAATHTVYLYAKEAFDFEDGDNSFDLELTINDGGEGSGTTTSFSVSVNDVDDVCPSNCALDGTEVEENDNNALIGSFTFDDEDSNKSDNVVTLSDASGLFILDSHVLYADSEIDFESLDSSYPITITVEDTSGCTLTCEFTVNLIDLNDNAPESLEFFPNADNSDPDYIIIEVAENEDAGTTVSKASWSDDDRATSSLEQEFDLYFAEASPDTDKFTINPSSTHVYDDTGYFALDLAESLDREEQDTYIFDLTLSDGKTDHAKTITVEVRVTDVDDNAPRAITLSNSGISETAGVGDTIGTITFHDDDDESTGTYTVSFTDPDELTDEEYSGVVDGDSSADYAGDLEEDSDYFSLVKVSDKEYTLVTAKGFAFHEQNEFTITVYVSDGTHTITEDFTLVVADENNNPPSDLSLSNTNINENMPVESEVGVFSYSELDSDEVNDMTYTITNIKPDSDDVFFTLGDFSDNGDNSFSASLKTNVEFDFEDTEEYIIQISVSDGTFDPISIEETITINDVNDNLPTDIELTQNDAAGVPITYPDGYGSQTINESPSGCTGTNDSPCALIYKDENGNSNDIWAIETGVDNGGRYPGWMTVCPTYLEDADGNTDCEKLSGDAAYEYVNPDATVLETTPYCSDSSYVEYYEDGAGDPDYRSDSSECVNEIVDCAGTYTYGECSVTCGGGTRTKTFNVVTELSNGGDECAHPDGYQTEDVCNTDDCEVNVEAAAAETEDTQARVTSRF